MSHGPQTDPELRGSAHRWLDLEALSQRLPPKDDINQICYFTARTSEQMLQTARQVQLWGASRAAEW